MTCMCRAPSFQILRAQSAKNTAKFDALVAEALAEDSSAGVVADDDLDDDDVDDGIASALTNRVVKKSTAAAKGNAGAADGKVAAGSADHGAFTRTGLTALNALVAMKRSASAVRLTSGTREGEDGSTPVTAAAKVVETKGMYGSNSAPKLRPLSALARAQK